MHGLSNKDGDRTIDWGNTSQDYAVFRPGPPPSFYQRLQDLGVGLANQRILDLGTGTGVLARQFARQGASCCGIDLAENQVATAQRLANEEGLEIHWAVGPAEELPWNGPFDYATANQCFLYFDKPRMMAELNRALTPDTGRLVTSHFSWMPRVDEIARRSEELVLEHNPHWTANDWDGVIPEFPEWARPYAEVEDFFIYDEPTPFTRETWAGRILACRGVGATMTPDEVARFHEAHLELLEEIAPPDFTITHRIDAHVFRLRDRQSTSN